MPELHVTMHMTKNMAKAYLQISNIHYNVVCVLFVCYFFVCFYFWFESHLTILSQTNCGP